MRASLLRSLETYKWIVAYTKKHPVNRVVLNVECEEVCLAGIV